MAMASSHNDSACSPEQSNQQQQQAAPLFDVSTAQGMDSLNAFLRSRSYCRGWTFTASDTEQFEKFFAASAAAAASADASNRVHSPPDPTAQPHAYRWYSHIAALLHHHQGLHHLKRQRQQQQHRHQQQQQRTSTTAATTPSTTTDKIISAQAGDDASAATTTIGGFIVQPAPMSLPATLTRSYTVRSVPTDMWVQSFGDRVVFGVSQLPGGRVGNFVLCQPEPSEVNPKQVDFPVTSLLGAGGRDDPLLSVYCRNLAEGILTRRRNDSHVANYCPAVVLAISLHKEKGKGPEVFRTLVGLLLQLYDDAQTTR